MFRPSCPPPNMPPMAPAPPCMPCLRLPSASNSSMKIVQPPQRLAFFFAARTIVHTATMSMPMNMPLNAEPELTMIGMCRLVAIALASIVFPVPGGPTIRTPRSRLPPALTKLRPCSISRRMRCISATGDFWPRTSSILTS